MKIFAYGTLKEGGILHKHMKGARFVKKRKIHGYALYLAPDETYPLLYYTGEKKDVVVGELWQISEKIKRRLDTYEEGYVLKKLLKSPIMTYYPNYDIKHLSRLIPTNRQGRFEFDVREGYYTGYNVTGVIAFPEEKPARKTKKKGAAKDDGTQTAKKHSKTGTQSPAQERRAEASLHIVTTETETRLIPLKRTAAQRQTDSYARDGGKRS